MMDKERLQGLLNKFSQVLRHKKFNSRFKTC
jgi:hypothetical protein